MKNISKSLGIAALCCLLSISAAAKDAKRPNVRDITFIGNVTYNSSRLEGLMLTRPSRFLAPCTYHPDVFQDDLETLTSFYRQNGFLQASVIDTIIILDSATNRVNISIGLREGVRTLVEGVTVFGNQFVNDSSLLELITIEKNDPLRRPVIEDAVANLLSLYAEHGFIDASVTPRVSVNDSAHLAVVDFSVSEGVSSRIDSIHISGRRYTRPDVIKREFAWITGDTLRYSTLIKTQQRLYLTGLFETVFVRPAVAEQREDSARLILVEVKERPSSELSFSVGYGSIEKVRGRAELSTINLAGTARKSAITLEANFIKQGAALSFSEPWTFGTRWKTDVSVYGHFRQEPAYNSEVIGGKLTMGRRLGAYTGIDMSYRLENSNITDIDPSEPLGELDPRIRSLALSFIYDSRDNLFDPSGGWYANWTNEVAGSFLQGSNNFAKSTVVLKRFIQLGRNLVIASAVEIGWMNAYGKNEDVPLSERYYAGGPTSLRGFSYQSVGPVGTDGETVGGEFKIVCNLVEFRQSFYKWIGGVVFFDFGNVWEQTKSARIDDLRADVGGGLRVNSPVGILRLDCGFNVDRRLNEPAARVFISMGQAF